MLGFVADHNAELVETHAKELDTATRYGRRRPPPPALLVAPTPADVASAVARADADASGALERAEFAAFLGCVLACQSLEASARAHRELLAARAALRDVRAAELGPLLPPLLATCREKRKVSRARSATAARAARARRRG